MLPPVWSRQHPPATTTAQSCARAGRYPQRARSVATPPGKSARMAARPGRVSHPSRTQPRTGPDREAADGLRKHPVLTPAWDHGGRGGPGGPRTRTQHSPKPPHWLLRAAPEQAGPCRRPAGATSTLCRAGARPPVSTCRDGRRCQYSPSQVVRLQAGAWGAGRGRRHGSQEAAAGSGTCPWLWKNSRKKKELFAAAGSGASAAAGAPRQPVHGSPLGQQHGQQTAGRGGPGSLKPRGASLGCRNPVPITLPLVCPRAPSPPGNNRHCWCPALLNTPRTGRRHFHGALLGTAPHGDTASTRGRRSRGVPGRESWQQERPGPLAAPLQARSAPPGASVSPGAVSAHLPRGAGADSSAASPGVTLPGCGSAFAEVGKLRHGTHHASPQERRDAMAATGVWEEPSQRHRGSTEETQPMSPCHRNHPVAGSAGATWLPGRNPPGAPKKGNVSWNWKKKPSLPTGPGTASSSARPCVSAGPQGWPTRLGPAPGTRQGPRLQGWQGRSGARRPPWSPSPSLGAARLQCGAGGNLHTRERRGKLRQEMRRGQQHCICLGEGRQLAALAQHSPPQHHGSWQQAGSPWLPQPEPGALSSALPPDAGGFISLPTYF